MTSCFTKSKSKNFFLLLLLLTTSLATCTKDFHYFSKAKFYIKSDHEKCSGVHVNGSYHRFISLNDSNSVDVDAEVLEKGPYYISTDTVNGMYFSAYGVLMDTGNYTFHMVGNGLPEKKENTHFTLISLNQSSCSVEIPVFDYVDTINVSEYAWEFYDNGIYHHGHVDTTSIQLDFVSYILFKGPENTNPNAIFGLSIMFIEGIRPLTLTDSLSHSFRYVVDQHGIFSTYRKPSTVIIDSFNYITSIIKGRFSWKGLNDEGILHEVKDGKFYVKLDSVFIVPRVQ